MVIALVACWTSMAHAASLQISEFLTVNDHSIRDEDGENSDWIEIQNFGTTVEFLDGWHLTDDPADLAKWRFPEGVEIAPNAFRIVFASDKNRTNALGPLHTNFKLSSSGEYLALVDPLGTVVSEFAPAYPQQSADVSYGRDVGDATRLVYYPKPTPGERNATGGPGFAPEVVFSRNSGTFALREPFSLALTCPSVDAAIYYAYGTNVPGANTNVGRYVEPLFISNSTIVRARAFVNGLLPGPITSQSYVALADNVINFSSDLPLMIVHNFGQGEASLANQNVAVQTFEPDAVRSSLRTAPVQVERGRFHLRGITSSAQPKKQFFLEIQDEFGADKESGLLGLPEESDWALYAPYRYDPPMMHNPLAYEIMRDFGRYAPRTRYVELFLKDDLGQVGPVSAADYQGVYILTEKIKRDNNRVAIDPLEPEHLAEPEITGGYLFSIDQARTTENGFIEPQIFVGGVAMNWISPRFNEMTNVIRRPQVAYISDYFRAFTNALRNSQWTNGAYRGFIDVDSWVDYHLHQMFMMNVDGLHHSTYFYKPREGRITFGPPWDYDRSQGTDSLTQSFNPRVWNADRPYFDVSPWWSRLFRDPDFWQRYIDRYQELREGSFTTDSVFAHIDSFANQLWEAQLRDQARWGASVRTGTRIFGAFTFDFGSTPSFAKEVEFQKLWYAARFEFVDTNFLARPIFSRSEGWIEPGATVLIAPAGKPGTILYYTLDGTDPRSPGGAISPLAQSSPGPFTMTLTSSVCLVARSYNPQHANSVGGNGPMLSSSWSGLRSAGYFASLPPLRITELMYHPDPGGGTNRENDFEYIEVANIGPQPLNLNRCKIRGAIEFEFPAYPLAPGAAALVVANASAFVTRYGSNAVIVGKYEGHLDNSGERILLLGPCNEPILDFRYEADWYPATDGFGFSLTVVDSTAPTQTWNSKAQWRPSSTLNGSPGLHLPASLVWPSVVINEVLSHTDVPPPYDAVEFSNLSDASVNIGGWFLTDDFRQPRKYRFPLSTVIEGRGFFVLDETQFNFGNGNGEPFSFSSLGDDVYLFSADADGNLTGYVHGFHFGPQENGVTFGRHVTSGGEEHLVRQARNTLGGSNAGPAAGPVVISEIMYHPTDFWRGNDLFDNATDEFIELHNLSNAPVALAHPEFPLNTWHLSDAVKYSFPPGVAIPSGGFVLVVGFDPRNETLAGQFRLRYGVPTDVAFLGPWSGKLDNSSDRIELRRPDAPRPMGPPDYGLVPYPLTESIQYSENVPWPMGADGNGASLHRIHLNEYGNDPLQWVAARPSPGRPYIGGPGPTIIRQPSSSTVTEESAAGFDVLASGAGPLSYQWRHDGKILPAQTNAALIFTNVQQAHAGLYQVVISDAASSVISGSAQLTVRDRVKILRQPEWQTVAAGSSVAFSVTASGTGPLTYQWRFDGTNLPGETRTNLLLFNVTNVHDGSYTVLVADTNGSKLSERAVLTVLLRPQMISPIPPIRITAVSNQVITLGAQTIGTLPMLYRWRRINSSGGGVIVTNIVADTRSHFVTFPLSTLTNGTYTYTLILSNRVQTNTNVAVTNAFVTLVTDGDQDGLPDDFELAHQFHPGDASDAGLDADGDGLTNLEEFLTGTDPRDASSFLSIIATGADQSVKIQFGALSNRTYTVEYSDRFTAAWLKLVDIPPQATNRIETVLDPLGSSNRYYRLVTPRQP